MNFSPLIPDNENNHDVASVLQEEFQEYLGDFAYQKHMNHNICVSNVDIENINMKNCAQRSKVITVTAKDECEDINKTELDMMTTIGKFMVKEELTKDDFIFNESIKLKREEIFENLHPGTEEKFGLIRREDLLKNKIEQSLDFQYNRDLHTCKKCFDHKDKLYENENKRKPRKAQFEKDNSKLTEKHEKGKEKDKVFLVTPDKLPIYNYELNNTYKRHVQLTNISTTMQAFRYAVMQKYPNYAVKSKTLSNRLAPGMSAYFLVTFTTDVYLDNKATLTFTSIPGLSEATVELTNYRDFPCLRCYIFRSTIHMIKSLTPMDNLFQNARCAALNNSIDCGACLIGGYKIVTVICRNDGPVGRFFIISEDDWLNSTITQNDVTMQLRLNNFTIFPSFFEVGHTETVEFYVMFKPTDYGLSTEQVYMLCDNMSYQMLELCGDGIMFQRDLFTISVFQKEKDYFEVLAENVGEHDTVFMGYLKLFDNEQIVLNVTNKSAANFKCYWLVENDETDEGNVLPMPLHWLDLSITQENTLPAFCESDFPVDIRVGAAATTYYNVYLSLYLAEVPPLSLPEDSPYTVFVYEDSPDDVCDVLISTVEIACHLRHEIRPVLCPCAQQPEETSQIEVCTKEKLRFSTCLLNFGVLPKGVVVHKTFKIESLVYEEVSWRIIEIKIDIDKKPGLLISENRLSCVSGVFTKIVRTWPICYEVVAKEYGRWASLLLLLIEDEHGEEIMMDMLCLVVYEIAGCELFIHTDQSDLPILCPLDLLYVSLMSKHTIYIHNVSLLVGCFWFLNLIGDDIDSVTIRFNPRIGIVQPGECVKVEVEIIPLRSGIFEHIYVPCFIGKYEKLLMLQVLYAATGISACFYLPAKHGYFSKTYWPLEVEESQLSYDFNCDCQEIECSCEYSDNCIKSLENFEIPIEPFYRYDITPGEGDFDDEKLTSLSTVASSESKMMKDLKSFFGDELMLMNDVVEFHDIKVRTPTKLSFYIENLTPVYGWYNVDVTNFGVEGIIQNPLNRALVKMKMRSADKDWDDYCIKHNGILVLLETYHGNLSGNEVKEIVLWVYANTWGTYVEEIAIEIEDLNPFCFSLVMEVLGLPLEFPFALNTLCSVPTLRLGHIPYYSEPITRNVTVKNVSAIPVYIVWHLFKKYKHVEKKLTFNFMVDIIRENNEDAFKLYLSNDYHGSEGDSAFKITPREMKLNPNSSSSINLELKPRRFTPTVEPKELLYEIIGYAYPEESHESINNILVRHRNPDFVIMQVTATLQQPKLQLNLVTGSTKFAFHVNQLLFENIKYEDTDISLINNRPTPVKIYFHLSSPFEIVEWKTILAGTQKGNGKAVIRPHECIQFKIRCHTPYKYLMEVAEHLYFDGEGEHLDVDKVNKVVKITRFLNLHHSESLQQSLPLRLVLAYPNIEVVPPYIQFDYVCVGETQKKYVEIHNLTEYPVKFEVYKSCNSFEIVVRPHHGEIAGSTGMNRSLVQVFVYFTPIECKHYQDSLRIHTNILSYFIDIPMNGDGVNNEKFSLFQQYS